MSLKTRCPACDTVFKIVPDQLKVSKGWVRCGRCAEVFDAAAHAAAPDETNPWPQTSPTKTPTPNTTAARSVVATANTTNTAHSSAAIDVVKDTIFTPKNVATEAANTPAKAHFQPSKEQIETDLSFVKVAKSKAFWQQKNVIASLRVACFCLAGLLFFQTGFSQRNHLVAANPALKTSFESVCQTLGCKIEALKNIDAFKIDSSSFQKASNATAESTSAEVFALKLSLKNTSNIPLAMPSVELTLTEAGDKPVIRRVLSAKDLGFNGTTLAANDDWTGEMTLAVTSNPATAPVSGYRVLLFYP